LASASVGVDGIGAPVAGQPQRADQVVGAHEGPAASGLGRRDDVDVAAEAARHGGQALELVHPLRCPRHAHAAGTAKAGGLARLGLQLLVELGAVLGQAREVLGGAKLPDQSRCVPRRAAGRIAPLQQQHVAPAELGEVIGDAAPGDAAADHDHPRV
jgi:hypothetical protein